MVIIGRKNVIKVKIETNINYLNEVMKLIDEERKKYPNMIVSIRVK